jgi:hypothetical protein
MSVHVLSWVLRHSNASMGDRLVLLVLADKAEHDGTNAWPSVATIARESRLTDRQVQRCLRSLEASGAIVRDGRHRKPGQNYGTHVYSVVMKGDNMSPLNGSKGDISDIPRVSQMSPDPSLKQPSVKPAATPRARNPVWDALSEIWGEPTTRSAQTLRGKLVASLTAAGATPEEIHRRAKTWPQHFDSATLTPAALEKHWDALGHRPVRRR